MKLKNVVTGFEFDVDEETAKEFTEKDRNIFKITEEGYKAEETKIVETPMFNSVVVGENAPDFDGMSRQDLRDYCKQNGISFNATYSRDKMLELVKG